MPKVTLRYDPAAAEKVVVTPRKVKIKKADTITFEVHQSTTSKFPNCRLSIKLTAPLHFAAGGVKHSDETIGTPALELGVQIPDNAFAALRTAFQNAPDTMRITDYECVLFDAAGKEIGRAGIGGEIVPDINS